MKWLYLLIMMSTCFLLISCVTIPLPVPSVLVPKDETNLENPYCFRFKGKLYVLGGYYRKKVPRSYNTCKAGMFCNTPGMSYKYLDILNKQIFEITVQEDAFILESLIKKGNKRSFPVDSKSWKKIGNISAQEAIRHSEYYQEFKGNIYAIGGKSYHQEMNKYNEHADVWMSSNLIDWKQVTGKVPWSMEKNCRINHKLAVVNDIVYLSGGSGMTLNGDKNQMSFSDLWKSEDGKNWQKVTEKFPAIAESRVLKLNSRYFYIDDISTLYASNDGKNWRMLLGSFRFGILNDKLTMIITADMLRTKSTYEPGLYYSDDGLEWRHGKTGKSISFVPRILEKSEEDAMDSFWFMTSTYADSSHERYEPFKLFEFKDALWLIGNDPKRVYKTNNGLDWHNVKPAKEKQFLPRSGAAIGAYNGYIWVMGGVWLNNAALGDIWKSRDGVNWELVTNNAPWGTSEAGSIFVAKGRLFLLKSGVQWDQLNGVVPHERELWSTVDGIIWQKESDGLHNIVIRSCTMDTIDRIFETREALYLLDSQYYGEFLRSHGGDDIQKTHLLDNFRSKNSVEIRMKNKTPLYISIDHLMGVYTSNSLTGWEHISFETEISQEGRGTGNNFLLRGDSDIRYKPIEFQNRLFLTGVDFYNRDVYSAEIRLDQQKETMQFLRGSQTLKGQKTSESFKTGTEKNKSSNSIFQTSTPIKKAIEEKIAPDTFRIKVVEHLSWDAYHGPQKGFLLGHKDNKPIVGMSFKIKLPDGKVVAKNTDNSGVIEINGLGPEGTCDLSYEQDGSEYPHAMFYEQNEPVLPQKEHSSGSKLIWLKKGLVTGRTHLFSY